MLAPAELKEIHPLGKSPVISIESPSNANGKPLILAESAVITEYLCEHFGGEKLVPQRYPAGKEGQVGGETEEWMRNRYFMHYAEGSLMPFLVMQLVMEVVKNPPIPFFLKFLPRIVAGQVEKQFLSRNITAHFDFLEEQLKTAPGGGPFLCGEKLAAADIMMSFPLIAASSRLPMGQYPALNKYIEKIQAEEGYQRAVRKIEEVEGEFVASN